MAAAADTPPISTGLQAGVDGPSVIVTSDHGRRPLAWSHEQIGDAAIEAAVAQLAGQRRPCMSNVTKALDIAIPGDLALTSANTTRARITALRSPIEKK